MASCFHYTTFSNFLRSSITNLCLQPVRRSGVVPKRPQKLKYAKFQKNIRAVLPVKPDVLKVPVPSFAQYGIYAKEAKRITPGQLESVRIAIVRNIGKTKTGAKVILRVFPHIPVTKKGTGVRMGKGKGNVDHFISFVKAGSVLFEYDCSNAIKAKKAYKAATYKLPIPIGFVERPPVTVQ